MCRNVFFQFLPGTFLIANLLALRAYGEKGFKDFDLGEGSLEVFCQLTLMGK